jgi:hypothetical protein
MEAVKFIENVFTSCSPEHKFFEEVGRLTASLVQTSQSIQLHSIIFLGGGRHKNMILALWKKKSFPSKSFFK